MLGYFDSDEDLMKCKEFCNLWKENLPSLRADMYRIISDVSGDYGDINVYAFSKGQCYFSSWEQSLEILRELAFWQDCDMQIIMDTMPHHLYVETDRISYVRLSIAGISTAKTIVEYYGEEPEIFENKYGVNMIRRKG